MPQLFTPPFQTTLDANAEAISGAQLRFYQSGTLTPATVYADAALTTPAAVGPSGYPEADSAGRFQPIYLDPKVRYRVIVADASGAPIRDVDPVGDSLLADLEDGGALYIGYQSSRPNSTATTLGEVNERRIDVLDFVSASDREALRVGGKPDLAYAYNRAMQAAAPYVEDVTDNPLFCTVHAPNLPHCVRLPVFIRRGVSLVGGGHGAVVDAQGAVVASGGGLFCLGRGSAGLDPGGAPSEMRNFRIFSGPAGGSVIFCEQPGASIRNIFLTSCDTGVTIKNASDVMISDLTADQGTVALRMFGDTGSGTRNCVISNLITFSMGISVQFDSNVYDVLFNNCLFCYTKSITILCTNGSFNIRNVRFNSGAVVQNMQSGDYAGMAACLRSLANNVQLRFANFAFRNYKGVAVWHDNGIGFNATFDACEFDGESTDQVNYNDPTTTARVYIGGTGDRVRFRGCTIAKQSLQPFETTGTSEIHLLIDGCDIYNNTATSVLLQNNSNAASRIVLQNNIGDGSDFIVAPASVGTSRVVVQGNSGFVANGSVASAATISIPIDTDLIFVTGTATVTSIAPSPSNIGRRVTFILGGSQTWTDGGSLALQSDFAGTVDDTLTLACSDGTQWYEIGRSPN